MRLWAGLFGVSALAISPLGCGTGTVAPLGVVASNQIDTLGEAFSFYVQWINTNDVKVEFDMTIDNEAPVHFELPRRESLSILIDPAVEEERDPIGLDADNVIVVRINADCPDRILFTNVVFGDAFSSGDIVFEQSTVGVADETGFGPDENGVLQPVTFFCFTSWQIIVQDSSITITGLDRAAVGVDEAEVVADDALRGEQEEPPAEDTLGAPPPEPRPLPAGPRIIDGPPTIGPIRSPE